MHERILNVKVQNHYILHNIHIYYSIRILYLCTDISIEIQISTPFVVLKYFQLFLHSF